jgi:hypothetical protein
MAMGAVGWERGSVCGVGFALHNRGWKKRRQGGPAIFCIKPPLSQSREMEQRATAQFEETGPIRREQVLFYHKKEQAPNLLHLCLGSFQTKSTPYRFFVIHIHDVYVKRPHHMSYRWAPAARCPNNLVPV